MHPLRELYKKFAKTHHIPGDEEFAKARPCECSPAWPALETTANGYVMRALPSSHYSVLTNPEVGTFVARCASCHARYPDPWVVDTTEPMPFAWARESDEPSSQDRPDS
ncbi:hypothetical protein ACIQMV_39110 [Streptomyces sp. NPDC091412]|uniref:hypothetical protein n=1 Tax=Streptomyces sp. NPDC091412 TaxID=3366002 RepID=UPI003822A655